MAISRTIVIDGRQFNFKPLPAWDAWELQPKIWPPVASLIALFLESDLSLEDIAKVADGSSPEAFASLDVSKAIPSAAAAVRTFFGFFDKPGQFKAVAEQLLAGTTTLVEGKTEVPLLSVVDEIFAGKQMMLFRVVIHAVRVNFPDFFALGGSERASPTTPPASATAA